MASAEDPRECQSDDLINLHSCSPVLPRTSVFSNNFLANCEENLIDTELPVLEEKLQTAPASSTNSYVKGVDVEDVLISIDDDDVPDGIVDSIVPVIDLQDESIDSLEVLSVLEQLDDILNETLEDGQISLSNVEVQSVEDCLKELDNYLKTYDENVSIDRNDLSKIDFLEDNRRRLERSMSLRDLDGVLIRNDPSRCTVGGVKVSEGWGQSQSGDSPTPDRISGPSASLDDGEANRQAVPQSRTHPPGDCCTGTIVVEPLQRTSRDVAPGAEVVEEDPIGSSWLRSSMRRVQPFRLPETLQIPEGETVQEPVNGTSTPIGPSASPPPAYPDFPLRPFSAPSRMATRTNVGTQSSSISREPGGRLQNGPGSSHSRGNNSFSSSSTSLASTVDTTPSNRNNLPQVGASIPRRSCNRQRQEMPEGQSPLGHWPHGLSSMLACLGCTVGLFNISRFAVLTVHFGANFIFQFFFLSLIVGLPLLTLQQCLGQQLGAGVIDMWKISPLFQGVGVALFASQLLIGLYSVVGVSWMFVYFRDSFITKFDRYRWAEPYVYYRDVIKPPENGTFKLSETVPDYFNGIVLQRHHLPSGNYFGTIKFQSAFNLVVIWMIVFVCLSKGLRSYGKVVYVFTLIPVFGMFIVCAKILSLIPPDFVYVVFPETSWSEFFLNTRSWVAASQEVILTWGLLGASIMQIASHNKHKHFLQRDSSLIAVITFSILLLAAFLANTCVQIIRSHGYNYTPNSFEKMSSYTFLRSVKDPLPPSLSSLPVRYMNHQSFIVGERVSRPGTDYTLESGYQALRFATELVPTTFALMGAEEVSPFWAVLFYFILIMFGIAQQLAIWHCVITGITAIKSKLLKSWETTITFFSCACGFLLGLPLATEFGIYVVYFLDFTVGGVWWLIVVILLQIIAVFMIRGRPYSGDMLVHALFKSQNRTCWFSWAPALLSFTWNVILPVALMIFCISFFKNGHFRELFVWHSLPSLEYWPMWARQIGSMLQLFPILCVPFVAIIQSYRYLNKGPPDILDDVEAQSNYRVQLLYRPRLGEHMENLTVDEATNGSVNNTTSSVLSEDPPPKYTPPPSYTTATGARIAKFLHQSIRRSMRRITNALGESSSSRRPQIPSSQQLPPPDYSSILVEMNQSQTSPQSNQLSISVISGREVPQPSNQMSLAQELAATVSSSSVLSVADVACILRNSFRRSRIRGRSTNNPESLSAENLVETAAPIGETSLVVDTISNNETQVKPADHLSSVI